MNNNIIDPFAEEETIEAIPAIIKTAVAIAPQFDELSIFFAKGNVTETIKSTLLESFSSLQAYVIAKRWAEAFVEVEKSVKEMAINQTNDKKTEVVFAGRCVATVSERANPKKYKYSDKSLDSLMVEAERIEAAIKERKKLLETIKSPMADATTGEMMYPAEKIETGITIAVKYTSEGK